MTCVSVRVACVACVDTQKHAHAHRKAWGAMPKLLTIVLMILLAALAVVIGEAAETSRAALAIVVTVFAIGLSIPASLAGGLVLERRRPRTVHHHTHQHLHVHQSPVDVPQVSEPERGVTIR